MQTNRWLTTIEPEDEGASHSPVPQRASVWIDPLAQQNISASYVKREQRVIPNPQTPIPARASAPHASHSSRVRPRYTHTLPTTEDADVTRIPTLIPPTMWQYELLDYEAESSISSLSLAQSVVAASPALDELDTLPPPRITGDVAELDTLPPPRQNAHTAQKSPVLPALTKDKGSLFSSLLSQPAQPQQRQKSITLPAPPAIDQIATVPPRATTTIAVPQEPIANQKLDFLERVHSPHAIVESSSNKVANEGSWTAGPGKNSLMAQRIVSRRQRKSTLSLNPLDRLRWWLLYPGRIEFLLWLSGTIVLVGVTCMLLFATLLSTGLLNTGLSSIDGGGAQTSGTASNPATGKSSCTAENAKSLQCHTTTAVSTSGLKLTLVDNALLLPDTPIYVHGQGFTANNTVNFTYDVSLPCRPATISTDTQGTFSLYIMLGAEAKTGTHQIVAYDVATKHTVTISITISPSPTGKSVAPTSTPVKSEPTPIVTSRPGGNGGAFPTPVSQTPIPTTPTVDTQPTAVSTQQPVPTVGTTPEPTAGITPTLGITPTVPSITSTAGTQHTDAASLFKNTLYDEQADGHISISIWLWIAVFGYTISMTMLGCAGILYRRNRRISSK